VYAFSEDGCIVEDSIEVNYFDDSVRVSSLDINFDDICLGVVQEISSNIDNLSLFDISITDMQITGDDAFVFDSNLKDQIITAGNSKQIKVIFSPKNIGNFESRIKIYYTHFCPDSLEILLTGSSNFKSTLILPDVKATSGERLCFPITYNLDCVDSVNIITSFIIEIKFQL